MPKTTIAYDKPTVWVIFDVDEHIERMTPELQELSEKFKREDRENGIEELRSESVQDRISTVGKLFHQLPDGISTSSLEGFQCYTPEKADAKLNTVMCYEIRLIEILCDFLEVFMKASPVLKHSEETKLVSCVEGATFHRGKFDEETLGFFFQFIVPNYRDDGKVAFTSDHLSTLKKILLSKNAKTANFAKYIIDTLETITYSQKLGILTQNCVCLLQEFHNYISKDPKLLKMSSSFSSILKINRLLGDYFVDAAQHPDDEFLSTPTLIDQLTPILDLWLNQQTEREVFYRKFKMSVFAKKNKILYQTMFQNFAITLKKYDMNGILREKITNHQTYLDDCQTLYGRIRQILSQEDACTQEVSGQKKHKASTSASVGSRDKKTSSRRKAGHKPKHKKGQLRLVSESPTLSPVASSSSVWSSSSSVDHLRSAQASSSSSFACSSSEASSSNSSVEPDSSFVSREIRKIEAPYPFSPRVLDMLSDTPTLLQQGSYADLSDRERRRQHLLHGFSLVVDSYISTHAQQTIWNNRTTGHQDSVYFIPGQIKWEGERMSGIFNFTVGEDGDVYHRFFSRRPVQELMILTLNSFRNIDFPSLEQASQLGRQRDPLSSPVETTALYGETVRQHRIYNSIHIKDPRHKATLILYPKAPAAAL